MEYLKISKRIPKLSDFTVGILEADGFGYWWPWIIEGSKGQLNSKWIDEVIVSPKMQTKNYKDFCPTKQTRIIAKKNCLHLPKNNQNKC